MSKKGKNRGESPKPKGTSKSNEQIAHEISQIVEMEEGGDLEGALEAIENLAKEHPRNAIVLTMAGVINNELGNYFEALDHFRVAHRENPRDPFLMFDIAETYSALNMPFHANLIMKGFKDEELKDPQVFKDEDEDNEEVVDLVNESVELRATITETIDLITSDAGIPMAKFEKHALRIEEGHLAMIKGKTEEAEKLFAETALALPLYVDIQHFYLHTLVFNGLPERARQVAQHIRNKINRNDPKALTVLIRDAVLHGNRAQAEEFRAELPPFNSQHPDKESILQSYMWLDQDEDVYQSLHQLLEEISQEFSPVNRRELGVAAARLGKHEEALQHFNASLEDDDDENNLFVETLIQTLEQNLPGPPPDQKFPYFIPSDYVSGKGIFQHFEIMLSMLENRPKGIKKLAKLATNEPGMARFIAQMIWAGAGWPEVALYYNLLVHLPSPEVENILTYFAFARAGDERVHALAASGLVLIGALAKGTMVDLWSGDQKITHEVEDWDTAFTRAMIDLEAVEKETLVYNGDEFEFAPLDDDED